MNKHKFKLLTPTKIPKNEYIIKVLANDKDEALFLAGQRIYISVEVAKDGEV